MTYIQKFLFVLSLLIGFVACKNKNQGPSYSIEPPFKTIPAVYDQFELNAAEAKVLRLPNGSSIDVPENAFVDKDGKSVTGKVSLKYREFHSASDIIVHRALSSTKH